MLAGIHREDQMRIMEENLKATDPNPDNGSALASSTHSREVIANAQAAIRKNSSSNDEELIRRSRIGASQNPGNLEMIEEQNSRENSRIQASGNLDDDEEEPNQQQMNNLFAATANQRGSQNNKQMANMFAASA